MSLAPRRQQQQQQRIGTPSEDAYRRDLTINALFYNINTRAVEDFTGRGVSDLRAGIVRTPLAPLETFCDDPLRVLRSIRFAARLGFRCEPGLLSAAAAPVVRDALRSKISRERIGKELSLMMLAPRFDVAVGLLHHVGLWNAVFRLPETILPASSSDSSTRTNDVEGTETDTEGTDGNTEATWDGAESVRIVGLVVAHEALPGTRDEDEETMRKCVLLGALLYPLRAREYLTPKKRRDAVTHFVVLDSLKLSSREAHGAQLAQSVAAELGGIMREIIATGSAAPVLPRGRFGMLLRRAGPAWVHALGLAACALVVAGDVPADVSSAKAAVLQLHATYQLGNAWEQRPLVSVCGFPFFLPASSLHHTALTCCHHTHDKQGIELCTALEKKRGPWIQPALEKEFEWMFDHPAASREDCLTWAKRTIE